MTKRTVNAGAGAGSSPKRGTRKLALGALVLLVAGLTGYFAIFKPSTQDGKPKPGEVLALDPVQVNLADGHFLKIGIALQLTEEAVEVDGSKAIDATIAQFSGTAVSDLSRDERRRALKARLERRVMRLYDDEVMGVYFVDFVTQ